MPGAVESIGWVHPVVLAITWVDAIIATTRVPAAEVDRGTIDVLLGLPISRFNLFASETLVWLASGVALLSLARWATRSDTASSPRSSIVRHSRESSSSSGTSSRCTSPWAMAG